MRYPAAANRGSETNPKSITVTNGIGFPPMATGPWSTPSRPRRTGSASRPTRAILSCDPTGNIDRVGEPARAGNARAAEVAG
ncbi:hypothetical protein GCM10009550_43120 [Actinocorallia libanotica]|uniref:Uncharacterized protein n=1 Tax=Actinocorallia libanotica TaxID=46162 RepID=A0ABN1RGE3_9ACTN